MSIFGVRLPSLRAPKQIAPAEPWPFEPDLELIGDMDRGQRAALPVPPPRPLAESYFVVSYYRDPQPRKITLTCAPGDIGAAVETAVAGGASHIEIEPVWEWRGSAA